MPDEHDEAKCPICSLQTAVRMNAARKVGDQGQRYMVVAEFAGETKTVGWTSDETGGSLLTGAKRWPACTNARLIDRHNDEDEP